MLLVVLASLQDALHVKKTLFQIKMKYFVEGDVGYGHQMAELLLRLILRVVAGWVHGAWCLVLKLYIGGGAYVGGDSQVKWY